MRIPCITPCSPPADADAEPNRRLLAVCYQGRRRLLLPRQRGAAAQLCAAPPAARALLLLGPGWIGGGGLSSPPLSCHCTFYSTPVVIILHTNHIAFSDVGEHFVHKFTFVKGQNRQQNEKFAKWNVCQCH